MDALQLQDQSFDNSADMSLLEQQGEIALGNNGEQYADEGIFPFGEDIKPIIKTPQRAAHQCNICNKIFISLKGLQQHAIIHTDQKPFTCEICDKSFRFKSNLFEHKSVHSTTQSAHSCPYCGKTCRLKGNLKKHIKTHVTSQEELEEAWKPFASNRRPPAEVPADAVILRSNGDSTMYTTTTPSTSRPRKRKLGLGTPSLWIDKIRRRDILPSATLEEKLGRFQSMIEMLVTNGVNLKTMLEQCRAIAFEKFECPTCKAVFESRGECSEHLDLEHPLTRVERPMFCEICLKSFIDHKSLEQHEEHHKLVHLLVEKGELELNDPEILVPTVEGDSENVMNDQVEEEVQNQMPENNDPIQHDPSESDDIKLF